MPHRNVQDHWLHWTTSQLLQYHNQRKHTTCTQIQFSLYLTADTGWASNTTTSDTTQTNERFLHVRKGGPRQNMFDFEIPKRSLQLNETRYLAEIVLEKLRTPLQQQLIRGIQFPEFAWDKPKMVTRNRHVAEVAVNVFAFNHFVNDQERWDAWSHAQRLGNPGHRSNVSWELNSAHPFSNAFYNKVMDRVVRHSANQVPRQVAMGTDGFKALILRHAALRLREEEVRHGTRYDCVLILGPGNNPLALQAHPGEPYNIARYDPMTMQMIRTLDATYVVWHHHHHVDYVLGWIDRRHGGQNVSVFHSPWAERNFLDWQGRTRIRLWETLTLVRGYAPDGGPNPPPPAYTGRPGSIWI